MLTGGETFSMCFWSDMEGERLKTLPILSIHNLPIILSKYQVWKRIFLRQNLKETIKPILNSFRYSNEMPVFAAAL